MKRILGFIFLLVSFSASSQIVNSAYIKYSGRLLTTSVNSISGFSTTAGVASAPQTFTLTGTNLQALAAISAPTDYEVSLDNVGYFASVNTVYDGSGGLTGQPVIVYVRIKSTAPQGNPSGFVTITSSGASTSLVSVSGTVTGTIPLLTVTPLTLSGFTTTAGSASAFQTFTVSGTNLTANATVTAPSSFEVSTSSGSGYGSSVSLTQSGGVLTGQPVTVYSRIAASAVAGSPSGNVSVASTGATTQNVAVSGTVTAAGGNTAKFAFRLSNSTISGWNVMFGDQRTPLSTTDGTTGWTVATVAANWYPYVGTFTGSNDDGMSTGTFGADFPSSVVRANWYNSNADANAAFTGSNYNIIVSNLSTGNYTIKIISSIKSSVNSNFGAGNPVPFNVKFGSGSNTQQTLVAGDNTQNTLTFTGSITSGQTIQIHVGRATGFNPDAGIINGLIITKN